MLDLATIGIALETSGLEKGTAALKNTEEAANRTAAAATKVGESSAQGFKKHADAAAIAERQTKMLASATSSLAVVTGTLFAGLGLSQMIGQIDSYTKLTAQLRLATRSNEEYATGLNKVREISKTAQSDLSATAVLYARIANGTRELGIGQTAVGNITETVNLALKVSGATAAESASAMLQLSQAFGSGVLRGEEFNAVNEAAPRLMRALADGIGVPVGALKQMASQGEITSKVMADVLPKALADLRKEAESVQTISGAFTVLKNNILEFVGTQAQANGTVGILTGGIGFLADNLKLVTSAGIGLAAAKVAQIVAEIGAKAVSSAGNALAYAEAQAIQRQATLAAAQAEIAATTALSARLVATEGAIVVSRQEAIASLAGANATIAASEAQIVAARSAGALSIALALVREGEIALTAAMQARSLVMTELAILGQQQARVSAQVAAATTAQTAAQAALNVAQTGGGAAAGLAARALGFLGGPIGVITALLGLGVTAWSLWGRASEDALSQVTKLNGKLKDAQDEQLRLQQALDRNPNNLFLKSAIRDADALVRKLDQAKGALTGIGGGRGIVNPETVEQKNRRDEANQKDLNSFRLKQAGIPESYIKDVEELIRLNTAGVLVGNEYTEAVKKQQEILFKKTDKKEGKDPGESLAKQQAKTYLDLIENIKSKIAAETLEAKSGQSLTETQKDQLQINKLLAEGKISAAAATSKATKAILESHSASELALAIAKSEITAMQERAKVRTDEMNGIEAYVKNTNDANAQSLKSVSDRVEALKLEDLAAQLSTSQNISLAQAVEQVAIARLLEKQAGFRDGSEGFEAIQKEIDKRRELLGMIGGKEARTAREKAEADAIKATEKAIKAEEDARLASVKKIGDGLYEALSNGGNSALKKLLKDFKEWFARLVLSPVINPIAEFGASLLNPTAAGAGGAGNGLLSLAGSASNGYSLLNGAGSFGGLFSSNAAYGATLGTTSFGAGSQASMLAAQTGEFGLSGLTSTYSAAAGAGGVAAAAPVLSAAGAGAAGVPVSAVLGESAFAGSAAAGGAVAGGAGMTALAATGYGAIIVAVIAILASLNKTKSTASTGVNSSNFDAAGNRTGFETAYQGTNAATDKVVTSLEKAYLDGAKSLGIAAVGTNFSYAGNTGKQGENPNFALGGSAGNKTFYQAETPLTDAAVALASSRAVFAALQGSELPKYLKGVFDGIVAGESTQEQIKTALATAQAFKGLHEQLQGLPFADLKDMTYATAAALVAASGGMQQFTANVSAYYDKFYTEAEKNSQTTANLTKTFGDLGLTLPTIDANARMAFRALVDGQDLATEAGIRNKAALLGVAGAFDAVTTYAENAAKAAIDAAKKAADETAKIEKDAADKRLALVREQLGWQDKLDVLTGKTTQREISLRNDLAAAGDDTIKALIRQTYAQEDLAAATQKATETAIALAQAQARARLDSTTNAASNALAGIGRAVDAQKAAATAIYNARTTALQTTLDGAKASLDTITSSVGKLNALSGSLKSTLDGMRIIGSEGQYRAAAQAQIRAALATARSGGGLPMDGQLTSALATVSKPSEQLFATFQDYARDFYRTANDISDMSALTEAQLTGDELTQDLLKRQIGQLTDQTKTLKDGFDDQVHGLDDILDNARKQLDAANGIDLSVKSVRDALATFQASILALTSERARQDLPTSRGVEYSSAQIVSAVKTSLQQGYSVNDIYKGAAQNFGISPSKITAATDPYGVAGFTKQAELLTKKVDYSDQQIMDAIRASLAAGFSIDDVYIGAGKNFGISSAEIARIGKLGNIPGFAGGGDHSGGLRVVGERGMEIEATGPSRIFNASQTRDILQGNSNQNNNDEMVRELRELREEVRGLRAEARSTATATVKTAKLLDTATEGGRAMLTEAFA